MIVASNASPRNQFRHAPTGQPSPQKSRDTPRHSDSSRFNPPAVILTENPTGTGNEAISQHYWAPISCSCRNVSVHPAFSPESGVARSGSGLKKRSKYPVPEPSQKAMRYACLGWPDHARLISTASAHQHCPRRINNCEAFARRQADENEMRASLRSALCITRDNRGCRLGDNKGTRPVLQSSKAAS